MCPLLLGVRQPQCNQPSAASRTQFEMPVRAFRESRFRHQQPLASNQPPCEATQQSDLSRSCAVPVFHAAFAFFLGPYFPEHFAHVLGAVFEVIRSEPSYSLACAAWAGLVCHARIRAQ